MPLTMHADGLWSIPHSLRVRGLIPLGTRTTVARLPDNSLLLHSPGPLTKDEHAAISDLGDVSTIVSPNLEHILYIADAAQQHPTAQLWVAPGCTATLPREARTLNETADAPWKGALTDIPVAGLPKLQESVFLHHSSRTLILTDLAFNILHVDGFWDRLVLQLAGACGRFGPSRLFRSYFLQDRGAFRGSIDALLELDFDRIIVAHGEVVEQGGREKLREAFGFLR
ncbi:MAG: hypothetical protein ACI8S6_004307 [Myxococcota bacterium]|jgi:hypothetical protein